MSEMRGKRARPRPNAVTIELTAELRAALDAEKDRLSAKLGVPISASETVRYWLRSTAKKNPKNSLTET